MKLFSSFAVLLLASPAFAAQQAIVTAPIADLRSDMSAPSQGASDDKQQTQLLFGEIVTVSAPTGLWIQVNADQQQEFSTNHRWEGYPGWTAAASLLPINKVPDLDAVVIQKWLPVTANKNKKDPPFLRLPLGSRVHVES